MNPTSLKFSKIMSDILTGRDNETYDNGRFLALCSFAVYFMLAIGTLATGHPWQAMDFAGGVGTMAVGFGFNLRLKRSTEPRAKDEQTVVTEIRSPVA